MHIKFIYPRFEKLLESYSELYIENPILQYVGEYKMPPAMGIPILIKKLPDGITYTIEDENVNDINYDENVDLVAISFFTPQASYAYKIGDNFLKKGIKVIMGGMHPSMIPEDVKHHCTSVCIGEAEDIWGKILKDFRSDSLKPYYKADNYPVVSQLVSPIFDNINLTGYTWKDRLVSLSRGCHNTCKWCVIPGYQGNKVRLGDVDSLVSDIKILSEKGLHIYLTDNLTVLNASCIRQDVVSFFKKLSEFKPHLFLQSMGGSKYDSKYIKLLSDAGMKTMYLVFSDDPFSKRFFIKDKKVWNSSIDLIKELNDNGVGVMGSFGIGYDCSYEDQFDLILDFCFKTQLKFAEFVIATPFPNTPFWNYLKENNRLILPIEWTKYNCAHIVFKPKHLSEEKLLDGFKFLWKEFYSNITIMESLKSIYN